MVSYKGRPRAYIGSGDNDYKAKIRKKSKEIKTSRWNRINGFLAKNGELDDLLESGKFGQEGMVSWDV